MKVQPMVQVDDVEASSAWYQQVLGLVSGHGGPHYEMLFGGKPYESPLLLQLHHWDAEEHGYLGTKDLPRGNGSSLWFEVADRAALDAICARAEQAHAKILEATHWNPLAHHWEFTMHDPDGYVLVVATPFEMA